MKFILTGILLTFILIILACSSGNDGESKSSNGASCAWHGNCSSSRAPNGAYDCNGDSMMKCNNGKWEHVVYCRGLENSKSNGRGCSCKGGCGITTSKCSYAFSTCGGHSYETCGPFANAIITDKWRCVKN